MRTRHRIRQLRTTATLLVLTFLFGMPTQAQSKLPSVFLNHFYIVVDSTTHKDIEQSPFLRREFAATEQRTTVRTDMSYTGLYFYGTNTYFEFFDLSSGASSRFGFGGLAFGVDQEGGLQAIAQALPDSFSVGQQPITRQYEGKQVPWFYTGEPKSFPKTSPFVVWLMEYHERFLNEWNPMVGARAQGITRKQILQRYTAVLKDVPAKPYFEDVVALTVALDEERRKRLSEFCKQLGYGERTAGDAMLLKGPDIELRLVQQTEELRGIQEITMRVNRKPKDRSEFRFGAKSVLRFRDNGLATWSF